MVKAKRLVRWSAYGLGGVLLILVGVVIWIHLSLRGSLPILEGDYPVKGLVDSVRIERDYLGIPSVHAKSRIDAARALGFLHGQERFFQMDLMRRSADGSLSELFGAAAFESDKQTRLFLLRNTAEEVVSRLALDEAKLLKAYTEGVNDGLQELDTSPFEYLLLRVAPRPWDPVDSILVIHSMFMTLQDYRGREERDMGLARDVLPDELLTFLLTQGNEWDAPLEGPAIEVPAIPGPDVFGFKSNTDQVPMEVQEEQAVPGSNNWAISGARSSHGGAILADDMHLGIRVPNTWYRASLYWQSEGQNHELHGATLPGTPIMVVGTNSHIAWGFTNSYADYVDVINLQAVDGDPNRYQTPQGPKTIEMLEVSIGIKGEEARRIELPWTQWGPVIGETVSGQKQVIRWSGTDSEAINLKSIQFEKAQTLEEAVDLAKQIGIPGQNVALVDDQGRIAWTIMGQIPRRIGYSGRFPEDWSDGTRYWDGYLSPADVPQVVDPETQCIWTANSRVVGLEDLQTVGDGGYALGARAGQIRDRLLALHNADESDLLGVQLDDRAFFLERWRKVILDESKAWSNSGQAEFSILEEKALTAIENWGGHASLDSSGYYLVRQFRYKVHASISSWLFKACMDRKSDFRPSRLNQLEGPIWRIVSERPDYVRDPGFTSWNAFFIRCFKETVEDLAKGDDLPTWGDRNQTKIQHPISRAIPQLSEFLDMPSRSLPGDSHMPRVQSRTFGASMRMVVSPGREEYAYFHMPCGQSGHPLSPFYRKGHKDWEEGTPSPLLPGPVQYELNLVP